MKERPNFMLVDYKLFVPIISHFLLVMDYLDEPAGESVYHRMEECLPELFNDCVLHPSMRELVSGDDEFNEDLETLRNDMLKLGVLPCKEVLAVYISRRREFVCITIMR